MSETKRPIDDGGPAFPFTPNEQTILPNGTWNQTYEPGESGMSLRDWFAGMALQGIVGSTVYVTAIVTAEDADPPKILQSFAANAYDIADAMIAERNKPTEDTTK
jgi:hypothetical protein